MAGGSEAWRRFPLKLRPHPASCPNDRPRNRAGWESDYPEKVTCCSPSMIATPGDMPGLLASSSFTGGSKTMVFAELGERQTTIHLSLSSPTWRHQQSLFQRAKPLTLNTSEPGRRQRPRPDPHPRPSLLTKTPSSFFAGPWQEPWQHRYRAPAARPRLPRADCSSAATTSVVGRTH